MPGLVKIGCTGRMPEDRARELSDKSGVPARFVVAWARPVSNWQAVEGLTHSRLHGCRPNAAREFFSCSVPSARRAIRRAAGAYLRPAWLRLLVGPRRRRVADPVYARRRVGQGGSLLPVLLLVGIVGLLVHFRPAAPLWLPDPVRASVLLVERL
jgi:hypothetical protein